jgi:hypothetical protein
MSFFVIGMASMMRTNSIDAAPFKLIIATYTVVRELFGEAAMVVGCWRLRAPDVCSGVDVLRK